MSLRLSLSGLFFGQSLPVPCLFEYLFCSQSTAKVPKSKLVNGVLGQNSDDTASCMEQIARGLDLGNIRAMTLSLLSGISCPGVKRGHKTRANGLCSSSNSQYREGKSARINYCSLQPMVHRFWHICLALVSFHSWKYRVIHRKHV